MKGTTQTFTYCFRKKILENFAIYWKNIASCYGFPTTCGENGSCIIRSFLIFRIKKNPRINHRPVPILHENITHKIYSFKPKKKSQRKKNCKINAISTPLESITGEKISSDLLLKKRTCENVKKKKRKYYYLNVLVCGCYARKDIRKRKN